MSTAAEEEAARSPVTDSACAKPLHHGQVCGLTVVWSPENRTWDLLTAQRRREALPLGPSQSEAAFKAQTYVSLPDHCKGKTGCKSRGTMDSSHLHRHKS